MTFQLLETASQATTAPLMAFALMEFANASLDLVAQIAHLVSANLPRFCAKILQPATREE